MAIIGYGNQGHAHALNLHQSDVDVVVGLRPNSPRIEIAESQGLVVLPLQEAVQWADIVMMTVPDERMREVYETYIQPSLRPGQTLMFAHGFNIHFGQIIPDPSVNVSMVSPKGPGHALRKLFTEGKGLFAVIAVYQDPSGSSEALALSYAWGLGCSRAGLLKTTFREETETDLFSEQVVLCGGIPALVKAAFERLVSAGYQPESAYIECLHETKAIVDLMVEGGLARMRSAISDTAEWGGYVAGDAIVTHQTKATMDQILARIQSGEFASDWIAENAAGRPRMKVWSRQEASHPIEAIGETIREKLL